MSLLEAGRSGSFKWTKSIGNTSRSVKVNLQLSRQQWDSLESDPKPAHLPSALLRRAGLRVLEHAADQDQSRRQKMLWYDWVECSAQVGSPLPSQAHRNGGMVPP